MEPREITEMLRNAVPFIVPVAILLVLAGDYAYRMRRARMIDERSRHFVATRQQTTPDNKQ